MYEDRVALGLIEEVKIVNDGEELNLNARIDTGATIGSIEKTIAEKWNLPHERHTTVKSSSGTTKRKIIKLKIILGGKRVTGFFTVIDRSHMKYQILIGQDVLKKNYLVDPLK